MAVVSGGCRKQELAVCNQVSFSLFAFSGSASLPLKCHDLQTVEVGCYTEERERE